MVRGDLALLPMNNRKKRTQSSTRAGSDDVRLIAIIARHLHRLTFTDATDLHRFWLFKTYRLKLDLHRPQAFAPPTPRPSGRARAPARKLRNGTIQQRTRRGPGGQERLPHRRSNEQADSACKVTLFISFPGEGPAFEESS